MQFRAGLAVQAGQWLTDAFRQRHLGFGAGVIGRLDGPLIDQAGTVIFNNGSTHAVTGELVIGGVVTNGLGGNNAKISVDGATLNVSAGSRSVVATASAV